MTNISLSEIQDALAAADFPAGKDDLVRHAADRGASEAVQKALRSLPPVDYRSADEVIRSVHADVGSGPTAEQRSDPESGHDKPGVADHLR